MYARISRLQVPPAQLDETGRLEHELISQVSECDGYRGFMLLNHETDGTCVAITYWENEEAMDACEEFAWRRPGGRAVRAPAVERLRLITEG